MARLDFEVPKLVTSGGRPAAAVEITPESVVAAAISVAGESPEYAAEKLSPLSVLPGLLESNLGSAANVAAVSAAIRTALGQVQPRKKSVTLVVPDASVRVFVLDFDSLPSKVEEAMPVLRFRLRKSVPFDVETAAISYQVLSEGSSRLETQWKVLAAIMPGPVLAEYELAVRMAGYEPGAVLPASLAAMAAIDQQDAVLVVTLGTMVLTTAIVSGNDVLLYRTVVLPMDQDARKAEVQRSIAVAAAFYEDRLSVSPHRVLYSGLLPIREFVEMLDDPALAVGEVVPRDRLRRTAAIGNVSVAGVTGALAATN